MDKYTLDEDGRPTLLAPQPETPTLVIKEDILVRVHGTFRGKPLWHELAKILGERFPAFFAGVVFSDDATRERATHYHFYLPASRSEPYLVERAIISALADQAHRQSRGPFKLSFPTIDPWIVAPGHVPLGDDAKPRGKNAPTTP